MENLQDTRTIEEMKENYYHGKEMESRIITYLKKLGPVFTDDRDERLNHKKYTPDCIIVGTQLLPLEIKFTRSDLTYVQRKTNQYKQMQKWDGYLLMVTNKKFCLIHCNEIGKPIDKENSYCGHPCISFLPKKRYKIEELINLF